ncbi:MAG: OmpA family protein [Bacteroidota bacterium]|nr:OmpA family protein [Bacteroidota bacterium]
MKKIITITLICIINITHLAAQIKKESFEEDFNSAEKIFNKVYQGVKTESSNYAKGGYAEALTIFLDLYKQDTTNMNLAFKIGVCYQNTRRYKSKALPYFIKASTSATADYKESSYKEKNAPIIALKFLGDAYHFNYQFDEAIETLNLFITTMAKNDRNDIVLINEANQKIEMCKTAKKLVAHPVNIKIENLGDKLNSTYADYSPVLSADQNSIYFTSRRPVFREAMQDEEGNYMEDIYMAKKIKNTWSYAESIGSPINTDEHEATVSISPDGQTILIYKDDLGDGNIYSTSLDGDKWTAPIKLNSQINSKYWEPSACFSADGNTIYFTSNRPGGFGGRDIYSIKKVPNGEWGNPKNLGPTINTEYDEDAAFIHHDGVTLYFSSNGHKTMGGFDIFSSTLSGVNDWTEAENVGYPINTTDDDIYFVISPDGLNAYFSSFRSGGLGEKDNFLATFLERKETPLTLMIGIVNDNLGKPVKDVEIVVTDNLTEEIVGIYHPNSLTGRYIFILTPGRNYNITYKAQDRLFYSENMEISLETNYYEIYKPIILEPIIVGSKITLKNIFFDFDKATLRDISKVEIKNLVAFMKNNPNVKVEISGHTDSKGDDEYNRKLSQERAQAVVKRLSENGISAKRMKAKGYGETMPSQPNTNADGSDNESGRQMNRRVEFKIIGIN